MVYMYIIFIQLYKNPASTNEEKHSLFVFLSSSCAHLICALRLCLFSCKHRLSFSFMVCATFSLSILSLMEHPG